MQSAFQGLQSAIDSDAYSWLSENAPAYIAGILRAQAEGKSPAEIRLFVAGEVGPERTAIAIRCEQAARYLLSQG